MSKFKNQKGFTLAELLIVIVLIGILAGITVPTFVGMRDQGIDAKLTSSSRAYVLALEAYRSLDSDGLYPVEDPSENVSVLDTELSSIMGNLRDGNITGTYLSVDGEGYTLTLQERGRQVITTNSVIGSPTPIP